MQEWFNWHAWKVCVGQLTESSNLSPSATETKPALSGGLFVCLGLQAHNGYMQSSEIPQPELESCRPAELSVENMRSMTTIRPRWTRDHLKTLFTPKRAMYRAGAKSPPMTPTAITPNASSVLFVDELEDRSEVLLTSASVMTMVPTMLITLARTVLSQGVVLLASDNF